MLPFDHDDGVHLDGRLFQQTLDEPSTFANEPGRGAVVVVILVDAEKGVPVVHGRREGCGWSA